MEACTELQYFVISDSYVSISEGGITYRIGQFSSVAQWYQTP